MKMNFEIDMKTLESWYISESGNGLFSSLCYIEKMVQELNIMAGKQENNKLHAN